MNPGTFTKVAATIVSTMMLCALLATNFATASPVQMQVQRSQHTLLAGEQQDLYLLIIFRARELSADHRQERPALNLGLVLDRSGSMSDRGKIDYAIRTSCNLIDMLSPRDQLGVVEYDDQITVLWPSSPVGAPDLIKQLIRGLTPRNSTNLMGGLETGVNQVKGAFSPLTVNRVLLLSDGLANSGITDPWTIRSKVQEFRRQGITVSTLGLGLDYDEDLMQLIAEQGAGRYYYIENPAQMSRIFQQEMDFIFETVTRQVQLIFLPDGAGDQQLEVVGYPSEQQEDAVEITLEDFYAGETRQLLLRLTLTPETQDNLNLGELQFSYIDLETGEPVQLAMPVDVTVSNDQHLVDVSRDDSTTVAAALMDLEWQQVQYVRLFEQGEKEQALEQMETLYDQVNTLGLVFDDARIGVKLEALEIEVELMERVTPGTEAYQDFLKSSKRRSYFASKGEGALHARGARGDAGLEVEFIQQALSDSGYYSGPIDGIYSDEVTEAVKEFQRQKGLDVDGIAGPRTLQALGLY